MCSDNDILEVFRWFNEHKQSKIMFEIEKKPYIPVALDVKASSSTHSRFMGDISDVYFNGFEQDLFGDNECDLHNEGDNEDQVGLGDEYGDNKDIVGLGDESDGDTSPSMRAVVVVPEVPEEVCKDTDEYQDLFEGYHSKSDDDYCSDSGDEGPYGGVLLSTIALDVNSCLYPLAYYICEGETFLSWSCFLEQLRVFLKYPDYKLICFMSDRQKGVIGALKMQWPRTIIRPRTYLQLMEFIRRLVMSRFQLRKDECNTWKTDIPPSVNKKILENSKESRILKTLLSGGAKYEMLGVGRAYTTNLPEKTCECGQWQVSGVPCSHALVGIRYNFGVNGDEANLFEYIDPMLSMSAYQRTYSSMIHSIPDLCVWTDLETTSVDAPPLKR
ncbi:hypothetical protein Ddye_026367 [Dipteronia dyeriana]|uniref:SWIM-type domain-containing protein n=1 Tax=Dipteronia dyeriana TaxID=168575 RepID=A0AAD9TM28_9ROSI|nr:hypothetical protein Ddye_026367 [Dipteronia dyeriana]